MALLPLVGVTTIQDGGSSNLKALCYEQEKPKQDNNLYDIVVTEVEKNKKCMKIHFVGKKK